MAEPEGGKSATSLAPTETLALAELTAIVGAEHIRAATRADSVAGCMPRVVVAPADGQQVAQVLAWANTRHLSIAPRGGGTKLDWGSPPHTCALVLSLHRLDQLVEHAWQDMTATVQAGCSIGRFQRALGAHEQRSAIDPLWPENATIGGVLATNDVGALRLRYNGLRDQVLGMTIALPDGTLARSGGKVVKNVAGYDLQKLMTGAYGTIGVIVEATLRVYPMPKDRRTVRFAPATTAELTKQMLALLNSTLTPATLRAQVGSRQTPRLECVFEGITASLDAQAHLAQTLLGALPSHAGGLVSREYFFRAPDDALIARFSILPSDTSVWMEAIAMVAHRHSLQWEAEILGTGAGLLRLSGAPDALVEAAPELRTALAPLHGTMILHHAPAALRTASDLWGPTPDTLPLMRRVKEQFDPHMTLNPGRFIGGI